MVATGSGYRLGAPPEREGTDELAPGTQEAENHRYRSQALESVKHHLKPNRQRSVGPRQGVLAGRQLAGHPSGACVQGTCVLSRLMPPPQGRSRSVRSSDTRACAWVRLVSSRGGALRHTREGDEKNVRDRAGVEDVIHFARSLDERLPRAVRGGPALVADR